MQLKLRRSVRLAWLGMRPHKSANLTKQGLLAVRSMKVPREPILVTEKWRWKFYFPYLDHRYMPLCAAIGSMQSLCPGYFSILTTPLLLIVLLNVYHSQSHWASATLLKGEQGDLLQNSPGRVASPILNTGKESVRCLHPFPCLGRLWTGIVSTTPIMKGASVVSASPILTNKERQDVL